MRRVLVTGATGLVGRNLCPRLAQAGYRVRAALRTDRDLPSCIGEKVILGDISEVTDWEAVLADVDLLVHAAARTHVADGAGAEQRYIQTNVVATRRLAAAAARHGVSRFVYLSSIKVNGEDSGSTAFTAEDAAAPKDAYGRSKLAAEQALREEAAADGMEFAIVRPPLIYGPGVRANFLRLMRWVDQRWPLPFAAVRNRRSLVNVWNLTDVLLLLLQHPLASGRVWLVADEEDLSTPELVRRLAAALQRRTRLFPVPIPVLKFAAAVAHREPEVSRLCGSLAVDCSATQQILNWTPGVSVDDALARTAGWYREL